ncbi:MAG: hypothetical protein RJB62_634 [Pseudomonadota bacterium]|jgi:hypothetical protein
MATPSQLLTEAEALHRRGDYPGTVSALYRLLSVAPHFFAAEAERYVAQFPPSDRSQFWSAPENFYPVADELGSIFTFIYDRAIWGGGSGAGSDLRNTVLYVAYIQALMDRHQLRSVLDIGCGDWRFSRYLDFSGRAYLGYDVVSSVIATDQATYGAPHIRFEQADVSALTEFPPADLILCKDVLQHLSHRNVTRILGLCRNARYALITNDYHPENTDCADGETRPLDVSKPPFDFPAKPVLRFGGKVTFQAGG